MEPKTPQRAKVNSMLSMTQIIFINLKSMHLTLRGKKEDAFDISFLRISLISILEVRTRVLDSE